MVSSPINEAGEYDYSNTLDRSYGDLFERRDADWRNGGICYQIMVDRFAPSADLDAKRHLYPEPKKLLDWDADLPVYGEYLPEYEVWSQELEFWGGDLASAMSKLDYVQELGADTFYLCPIHHAWTNHGYDALDYQAVRPEYGTREDVKKLADELHARGMTLVLDGVFNHVGRNAEIYKSARDEADSPYRDWFEFNPDYPAGHRSWWNNANLPELELEEPAVRQHIWEAPDSVVRSYLRDGVDGWRLDVAFEIGMRMLGELTAAAHEEKPGSLVLGEITTYPREWFPELDAVLNFTLRELLIGIANGHIGRHAQRILQRFYSDCDFEHLLKSWVYLDNHDTARIATVLPDPAQRDLATVLQFTLPGTVNLYYGSELGMVGGDDPANRAPMRWDWVNDENPVLARHRQLIELRKTHRALRVGNLRWLETDRVIGFERYTNKVSEAVIVIANARDEVVKETVLVPDSKLMDHHLMHEHNSGEDILIKRSLLDVELQPKQTMILTPIIDKVTGYSAYKRIA